MKRLIFLTTLIILIIEGCHEIDISTPQASRTIAASKKYGFYLSTGHKVHIGSLDIVDTVWKERVWRYAIENRETKRISLSNDQIIVKVNNFPKGYDNKSYYSKWKILEKDYGALGSGSGVFILMCPSKNCKDTLTFLLHDISTDTLINIGKFLIR